MSEINRPLKHRKARPYLWLFLLLPSLATATYGWYHHTHFPQGGTVNAVKLSVKPGLVGQAAEAQDNLNPSTPDLYLVIAAQGREIKLPVKKETPVGNGLTWDLHDDYHVEQLRRVDVWDHHRITSDKQLDHITLSGWETDGQRFHVSLVGEQYQPPTWALPTLAAGAAVAGLVLLKFVWDQVI